MNLWTRGRTTDRKADRHDTDWSALLLHQRLGGWHRPCLKDRQGACVSEAGGILRSYVSLVRRLSGAASVSLYVPPGPAGEREILVHDGRLDPLPELADAASAASFHAGPGAKVTDDGEGAARLASWHHIPCVTR